MSKTHVMLLVAVTAMATWFVARTVPQNVMAASGQMGAKDAGLEKQLWEVDQRWLCSTGSGPYHKGFKECIDFRQQYWANKFFEISIKGRVQTKAQMVEEQTSAGFPA